jgi:hypothetical protein
MTTETALSFRFPSPLKQTRTQWEKKKLHKERKPDINGQWKERKGGRNVGKDKQKRRKKGHRN